MGSEEILMIVQRSRKYYFWWWCLFWLIVPAYVALFIFRHQFTEQHTFMWYVPCVFILPALIATIKRAALYVRIFAGRVVIERGILSKETKEIFISDIRTVDVKQSLIQRILGIGELTITTVGRTDTMDVIDGLPDPNSCKNLIRRLRQEAKGEARPVPKTAQEPEEGQ